MSDVVCRETPLKPNENDTLVKKIEKIKSKENGEKYKTLRSSTLPQKKFE